MGLAELNPCERPWFAPEGHSQTILGFYLPSPKLSGAGEKWILPLADGDQLFARVHGATQNPSTVLVMFHGLGGDIDSVYVHLGALAALDKGWTVVRANLRGAGEGTPLAKGMYHSGRSDDVSQVIVQVRARYPGAKIALAGFSLSGNVVLNLLGGFHGDARPDAAVVFNPAMQLESASQRLAKYPGKVYDQSFVTDMRLLFGKLKSQGSFEKDFELPKKLSVAAFDDLVTAPQAGYRDRHHYYAECSSYQRVNRIQVPTVVITAEDDPIVPADDFRTAKWSSSVRVRIEQHGGHIGYLDREKVFRGTHRWLGVAINAAFDELGF